MKVAVCVKEVPDASAPKRLDPQTFRLDRGVAGALNEFDTHAIEEGLQLKDKGGEGEVVAVLMGPERAAGFTMARPVLASIPRAQLTVTHGSAEINCPVMRSITKKNPFFGACISTLRFLPLILRSARVMSAIES